MRRWLIAMAMLLTALPGRADALSEAPNEDPTPGGGVHDGVPEAVVVRGPSNEVIAQAEPGGTGGSWTCHYFRFLPGEIGEQGPDHGAPILPEPGQYVALMCFDAAGQTVHTEALYYDPANPLGSIAAAERALEQARQQLDPPEPTLALNPPADGFQLVGVPSWFWIADAWQPLTASATLAGVTSTVIATPVDVRWDLGDGTAFGCDGPGTPYDPGRPAADQASDCTHTFRYSSRRAPGGTYTVTATVTYEVRWEATTGAGGPLESIARSASTTVRVEEAQAVIR